MTHFDFRSDDLFSFGPLRHGPLWLGLGVALVAFVVIGSLISVPAPAAGVMTNDKLVHLFAYATLMAWFSQLFRRDLTRLLLGLGFVALGILMEYLQGMVPSRQFDLLDMIANTSGVLLAWALSYTRLGDVLASVERVLGRSFSRA